MNYKASDVDGSWAVTALHETIKEFNNQSREQTAQMLKLTKVMAWLTGVMLLGLLVQIYLALWPPTSATATTNTTGVTTIAPGATVVGPENQVTNATPNTESTSPPPAAAASSASK